MADQAHVGQQNTNWKSFKHQNVNIIAMLIVMMLIAIALRVIGKNLSIETVLRSTDSQSAQTSIHPPLVTTNIKKANISRKQIFQRKCIGEKYIEEEYMDAISIFFWE